MEWSEAVHALQRAFTKIPLGTIGSVGSQTEGLLNFRQTDEHLYLEILGRDFSPEEQNVLRAGGWQSPAQAVTGFQWVKLLPWPVVQSDLASAAADIADIARLRGKRSPAEYSYAAWNEGTEPEPGREYTIAERAALRGGQPIVLDLPFAREANPTRTN